MAATTWVTCLGDMTVRMPGRGLVFGTLIKGCFAPSSLHKALGPISSRQLCYMCMPMRPNKADTAVHGCHYLGQEPIGLLPG